MQIFNDAKVQTFIERKKDTHDQRNTDAKMQQ